MIDTRVARYLFVDATCKYQERARCAVRMMMMMMMMTMMMMVMMMVMMMMIARLGHSWPRVPRAAHDH